MPDSDIKRTGPQDHLLIAPKAKEDISSPPVLELCGCSHNVHDNCSVKRPLPQRAHNSFTWTTALEILKEVLPPQVLSQGVKVGNKQRLTRDESK